MGKFKINIYLTVQKKSLLVQRHTFRTLIFGFSTPQLIKKIANSRVFLKTENFFFFVFAIF